MVSETLFRTTVQTSVQESMQTGKPLFVYLSDESEQSTTFVNRLLPQESDLIQKVETCFIAVKLIENTVDYGFFQQIFADISTPSFYIVSQGQILDIIHNDTSVEEFKQKMIKYKPHQTQAVSNDVSISNSNNSSRDPTPGAIATNHSVNPDTPTTKPKVANTNNTKIESKEGPAYEQNVKRHQAEVKAMNKQKQQEKDRLRALINADKMERLSQQKALENTVNKVPEKPQQSANSFKTCSLAIKLFDGSSIIHDFDANQTLNDVRSWLDTETEIIPDTSSLPSFASHTGPTHYVFHRPTIPRATFTDEQEFIKLAELDLCPRSALILKPIFTDVVSAYPKEKGSVFRSIYGATSKFASALYSFFDYGVDQMHEDDLDINENIITDSMNSGSDHNRNSLRDVNSGTTTPSLLSISDSHVNMSSLINIEDSRSNNTHHTPQSPNVTPQSFDSNNATPLISRVGTPISRLQTVHTLDEDDDKLNTYNGNSVNLNPNKKDEKKE